MRPSRRAALASTAGAVLALAQRSESGPAPSPDAPDAVADWIRRSAIRLSTPVAGHGFADMAPLKKVVGDARIVALGEATHGTREFFQLKHRMLEFLASEMGFSIFSIEAGMPEACRLNDFVLRGEGDPAQLLKGLRVWMWDTQEVLDMVLWMREFNRSGRGRVSFTGFDMQTPTLADRIVRDFVAREDPGYAPALARASEMLLAARNPQAFDPRTAVEWEKAIARLESLRPREGVEWAIQNARIVVQGLRMAASLAKPHTAMALRDASMAANVKWILDRSPGARMVLWAHNFHVMTSPAQSMGAALRKMYPSEMVSLGFAFGQGSFQAMSRNEGLRDFTLGSMPAGSLDATLAAAGIPLFALDLRAAPRTGPVAEWLGAKRLTRNVFAGFQVDAPGATRFEQAIGEHYDGPLFVEKTTAARPNPK